MDEGRQKRPTRARFSDDASDVLLLKRIVHGDRDALRALYSTYYHPLLRFLYRMTGQLDLAREAINGVMQVVWTNAGSFGGRSSVATWVMGIAYRNGLKALDSSRPWTKRFASRDFDEPIEGGEITTGLASEVDLQDVLDRALTRLSPEHRAVVELSYFYGCSCDEIAVIAGCPVDTVKTRMFHARAQLGKLLPALGKDGQLA